MPTMSTMGLFDEVKSVNRNVKYFEIFDIFNHVLNISRLLKLHELHLAHLLHNNCWNFPGSQKENGYKAQCSGDSGGPLVFKVEISHLIFDIWYLISIPNFVIWLKPEISAGHKICPFYKIYLHIMFLVIFSYFSTRKTRNPGWLRALQVGELSTIEAVPSRKSSSHDLSWRKLKTKSHSHESSHDLRQTQSTICKNFRTQVMLC